MKATAINRADILQVFVYIFLLLSLKKSRDKENIHRPKAFFIFVIFVKKYLIGATDILGLEAAGYIVSEDGEM